MECAGGMNLHVGHYVQRMMTAQMLLLADVLCAEMVFAQHLFVMHPALQTKIVPAKPAHYAVVKVNASLALIQVLHHLAVGSLDQVLDRVQQVHRKGSGYQITNGNLQNDGYQESQR